VEVRLSFEAAERTARISYDRDGKVAGLKPDMPVLG
jgi:hypothetical protein